MSWYAEEAQHHYFFSIQRKERFVSLWSIYKIGNKVITDVNSIAEGFQDARVIEYDTWDSDTVVVPVKLTEGSEPIVQWLDLWRAANEAIEQSGDPHHMFIEEFEPLGDGRYRLGTGS